MRAEVFQPVYIELHSLYIVVVASYMLRFFVLSSLYQHCQEVSNTSVWSPQNLLFYPVQKMLHVPVRSLVHHRLKPILHVVADNTDSCRHSLQNHQRPVLAFSHRQHQTVHQFPWSVRHIPGVPVLSYCQVLNPTVWLYQHPFSLPHADRQELPHSVFYVLPSVQYGLHCCKPYEKGCSYPLQFLVPFHSKLNRSIFLVKVQLWLNASSNWHLHQVSHISPVRACCLFSMLSQPAAD